MSEATNNDGIIKQLFWGGASLVPLGIFLDLNYHFIEKLSVAYRAMEVGNCGMPPGEFAQCTQMLIDTGEKINGLVLAEQVAGAAAIAMGVITLVNLGRTCIRRS